MGSSLRPDDCAAVVRLGHAVSVSAGSTRLSQRMAHAIQRPRALCSQRSIVEHRGLRRTRTTRRFDRRRARVHPPGTTSGSRPPRRVRAVWTSARLRSALPGVRRLLTENASCRPLSCPTTRSSRQGPRDTACMLPLSGVRAPRSQWDPTDERCSRHGPRDTPRVAQELRPRRIARGSRLAMPCEEPAGRFLRLQ